MVSVLPLVPRNLIGEACILCSVLKPPNDQRIERFYTYLLDTLFSEYSLFTIDLWTHCYNLGPRTNNNLEGFHSKINRLLKKAHPNIYQILNYIKKIQMENAIDLKIFITSGRERSSIKK
jgi:hypothetical protein